MHTQVSQQAAACALALLVGVGAGILYDVLRAVRRRFKSAAVTAVCDVLFCVVCFVVLFFYGMTAGGGKQRVFYIAVACVGGAVYFLTVSRFLLRFWLKMLELGLKGLGFAAKPFKMVVKGAKKCTNFAKNNFQKRKK